MAPTFPFTGLDQVEVFAVEDTVAQLVWRGLPGGALGVVVDDRHQLLGEAGRPGAAEITGLRPDTTHCADITIDGRVVLRRTIHTAPAIDGPELARVATISDLHLGETGFGLIKEMRERDRPADAYPMRCARAAVREAVAWGADLLVIKGDITEKGRPHEWDLVDEFLADIPIPVIAIPGNHDTMGKAGSLDATDELRRRALFPEPIQIHDIAGARVIAADTTIDRHSWGRMRHLRDDLVAAADHPAPLLLFVHQHLEERPIPSLWPLGTSYRSWRPTVDSMLEANPDLVVSSGHTHRNRARRHGSALLTEVGSTKDHPGVWAGYAIHTHGVRQVVRRVAEPDCLAWTDRTHAVVGGIWGQWSPGRIDDRSLTHRWVRRPRLTNAADTADQASAAPSVSE